MTSDESCLAAAEAARAAFRRGARPSQIVPELVAILEPYWSVNSVLLVRVALHAFRLSISECKQAEGIDHMAQVTNADTFDRYFTPLIERNRPLWEPPAQ